MREAALLALVLCAACADRDRPPRNGTSITSARAPGAIIREQDEAAPPSPPGVTLRQRQRPILPPAATPDAPAVAGGGPDPSARDREHERGVSERLRQILAADPALAAAATSIQIVTAGATVVLRGAVASEAERDAIVAKARALQGVLYVDDRLTIAPQR